MAEVLRAAYEEQKTILVMGNGGSGATASHMVCDMNKGACFQAEKKFRVISLTDNMPMILALGNDIDFESIFVEQLKMLRPAGRRGDRHLRQRQLAQRAAGHRIRQAARLRHRRRLRLRRRQAQAAGGPLLPRPGRTTCRSSRTCT